MPGRGTQIPAGLDRRKISAIKTYQTFNTPPPKGRGRPPSREYSSGHNSLTNPLSNGEEAENEGEASPLPIKQLAILAIIALCEQTALNSISPYLPEMTSTFPEVDPDQIGVYVGLIASSFALAQFTTNFFWGWLSDRIGRKPVIMISTSLTALAFIAWGLSRTLWQAVLAQVRSPFWEEVTSTNTIAGLHGIGKWEPRCCELLPRRTHG